MREKHIEYNKATMEQILICDAKVRKKKKKKRPNQALQAELRMTGWANSECKLLTQLNVGKAELYRAG